MRREGARPDPLGALIGALHADGRPRVWSLVVTVFGDAAAPRGGRMASAALSELLGRIGVGEGALRTALSRLVAEGTLERDRVGRASFHWLSAAAAREVAQASRLIYAPAEAGDWTLGTGPAPRRSLALPGGAWLGRELPPPGAMAVRGALHGAPQVEPDPAHAAALDLLARDLDALAARAAPHPQAHAVRRSRKDRSPGDRRASPRPPGDPPPSPRPARSGGCSAGAASAEGLGAPAGLGAERAEVPGTPPLAAAADLAPLDAMAARTLLIHRWRRLTLRWPDLPTSDGPGARRRVAAAYRALLPASEAWLDAVMVEGDVHPGRRGPGASSRFV